MRWDQSPAPQNASRDAQNGSKSANGLFLPSRRSFVWKLLIPSSLGGLLATTTGAAAHAGLRSRQTRRYLEEISRNVHGQVQFTSDVIQNLGGTPRPQPTFKNLRRRNLMAFLLLARVTANGGLAAVHNTVASAEGKGIVALGSQVASATARHAAYLNALLGQPLLGASSGVEEFVPEEVVAMKAAFLDMFVVDLNGGPLPEFDRNNPSAENDLLIANSGLLLKMFEAELYDVNLARFYR